MGNLYLKKTKVAIPTFNWRMFVVFTNDVNAYSKHMHVNDSDALDRANAICIYLQDEMECHLAFDPKATAGDIAHECWHAVRRMLTELGAGLDNEVVAYHLGYLVDQVISIQKGLKNVRKNKKRDAGDRIPVRVRGSD